MEPKKVECGDIEIGGDSGLVMIAGPCVIESREGCLDLAERLKGLSESAGIPLIFKASYDKANRTSHKSYRGPGIEEGLAILGEVKESFGLPLLTDVHSVEEVSAAAGVVDILQVPAFLCRQTDLVLAVGESGRIANIKKGQFLAPWDMSNVIAKIESGGNKRILLTERGVSFGYNTLVADMRSLMIMRDFGYPVIFDATHSVQQPGGAGDQSGGDSKYAPGLARAAVAVGCDGVFIETHIDPPAALSDKANAIKFSELEKLWKTLSKIDTIVA